MKEKMLNANIDTFVRCIRKNSNCRCYISYSVYYKLLDSCNAKFENNVSESDELKRISLKWNKGRESKISAYLTKVFNKEFEENLVRVEELRINSEAIYHIGSIEDEPIKFEI